MQETEGGGSAGEAHVFHPLISSISKGCQRPETGYFDAEGLVPAFGRFPPPNITPWTRARAGAGGGRRQWRWPHFSVLRFSTRGKGGDLKSSVAAGCDDDAVAMVRNEHSQLLPGWHPAPWCFKVHQSILSTFPREAVMVWPERPKLNDSGDYRLITSPSDHRYI